MLSEEVTVTLRRDQFNAVADLLQLLVVLNVRLYVQGPQPNKPLLEAAFEAFIKAGMPSG